MPKREIAYHYNLFKIKKMRELSKLSKNYINKKQLMAKMKSKKVLKKGK